MKANVVALIKEDGERYVMTYDDKSENAALIMLDRWAMDESLSFTWLDAALLSRRMRQLRSGREAV